MNEVINEKIKWLTGKALRPVRREEEVNASCHFVLRYV